MSLCITTQREPPSLQPILLFLSTHRATAKRFCKVFVHGDRFLSPAIGSTLVQFGDYGTLPATYYHSHMISFLVPLDAAPGIYAVSILNINDNLLNRGSMHSQPPETLTSWAELPFIIGT